MITVAQALDHLFALVAPLDFENIPLRHCAGRVLRRPVVAQRAQPPFAASAMDGYAVRAGGTQFQVVGEAPAGQAFAGTVDAGQAVRIFTGAPLPEGTDSVVIQEDVTRDGAQITVADPVGLGDNVRPAGNDFAPGDQIPALRRLTPRDLALAAAMNAPVLTVTRKPVISLMATGDELVMPGEIPAPDQIIASNIFGLVAALEARGADVRLLPIARDRLPNLQAAFARADGSDLIVTIGGASVGDHDLVAKAAEGLGMERAFYKIAMRPGKPLMAGRLNGTALLGLPGNPVSAMVCGHLFLEPMVDVLLGLSAAPRARSQAVLAAPLPANGPREHYMRGTQDRTGVRAFDRQDSSLLSVLAQADLLIVRPPHDPERDAGDTVDVIPLSTPG